MIQLCKPSACTGCSACANVCAKRSIEMRPDSEGFLHPIINQEKCVDCGLCVKVCPVLNKPHFYSSSKVYAAFNKDVEVRKKSSSGGMFYALAQKVVFQGGCVVGAMFKDNFVLEHAIASSIEDVLPMMGSKYVQSNISDTLYKDIKVLLIQGKKVLFTGTPCQVAACKQFIPSQLHEKLILVDIVCHGVPSQLLFRDYLKKLGCKMQTNVNEFNFRIREGWGVAPSFSGSNNSHMPLVGKDNLYMALFLNGYVFRNNCYSCQYAQSQRVSDITIADFWGVGEEKPYMHDKKYGISLLLVNSAKGEKIVNSLSDTITIEERTLSEAIKINVNLRKSSPRPIYRNTIYSYALNHSIDETYDYYFNSFYRKLRRVVGNILRKIK